MIRLLPRGHIFDFNPLLEPIPVTTPPLHEPHQALTLAPRTFRGEAARLIHGPRSARPVPQEDPGRARLMAPAATD